MLFAEFYQLETFFHSFDYELLVVCLFLLVESIARFCIVLVLVLSQVQFFI